MCCASGISRTIAAFKYCCPVMLNLYGRQQLDLHWNINGKRKEKKSFLFWSFVNHALKKR